MMQVFNQSLQVSVSVLVCIFTFEFQTESTANVFHVVSALLVLVHVKLPIFKILKNTWFYILDNVLYSL